MAMLENANPAADGGSAALDHVRPKSLDRHTPPSTVAVLMATAWYCPVLETAPSLKLSVVFALNIGAMGWTPEDAVNGAPARTEITFISSLFARSFEMY
jgi:hypothetical protein